MADVVFTKHALIKLQQRRIPMSFTYDPVADAINIVFKSGRVAKTREIAPGIMIDFDRNGIPLHLEILDASKRFRRRTLQDTKFRPIRYSKQQARDLLLAK